MENIKTDILVVGAGAAGIAATLSTSRMNRNLILAEQSNYVGGLITGGLVTLFDKMKGNETGIIQGIIKELKKFNGVLYLEKNSRNPTVNPEIFKIIVEKMLIEKGVRILYNSYAYKVLKVKEEIKKVFFVSDSTTFSIEPKIVIDCTGNGDIFYYCGEPFREYFSKDISIGLVVRIGGIDKGAENFLDSKKGEAFLKKYCISEFVKTPMESIFWTVVEFSDNKKNPEESQDWSKIMISLRKKALQLIQDLKRNDIFKDVYLLDTAQLLGVRMSRVLEGQHVLVSNCLNNREKLSDIFGCLLPKFTKNLLVAGRCISANFSVLDESVRLIPACFITGQLAGILASLSLRGGVVPEDINRDKLKNFLEEGTI